MSSQGNPILTPQQQAVNAAAVLAAQALQKFTVASQLVALHQNLVTAGGITNTDPDFVAAVQSAVAAKATLSTAKASLSTAQVALAASQAAP